jgi:hypothetical protein
VRGPDKVPVAVSFFIFCVFAWRSDNLHAAHFLGKLYHKREIFTSVVVLIAFLIAQEIEADLKLARFPG